MSSPEGLTKFEAARENNRKSMYEVTNHPTEEQGESINKFLDFVSIMTRDEKHDEDGNYEKDLVQETELQVVYETIDGKPIKTVPLLPFNQVSMSLFSEGNMVDYALNLSLDDIHMFRCYVYLDGISHEVSEFGVALGADDETFIDADNIFQIMESAQDLIVSTIESGQLQKIDQN